MAVDNQFEFQTKGKRNLKISGMIQANHIASVLVGFLLLLVLLTAFSLPVRAQTGSSYDWRSGNSYYWNTDSRGNTNVQGFNARTGSHWNKTIESDGDMRGYDGNNNPWTYDRGTGHYHNFGTGETCVGKGYARVCN